MARPICVEYEGAVHRMTAREYGYADGSGILRVVQRVDQAAARTPSLRNRLAVARRKTNASIV